MRVVCLLTLLILATGSCVPSTASSQSVSQANDCQREGMYQIAKNKDCTAIRLALEKLVKENPACASVFQDGGAGINCNE